MVGDTHIFGNHNVLSDFCAPCNLGIGNEHCVVSYGNIMGDMRVIIYLHPISNNCLIKRSPANRYHSANLNVVPYLDDSYLWNFLVLTFYLKIPKSIIPYHTVTMDNSPFPNNNIFTNRDVGVNNRIVTNTTLLPDKRIRIDSNIIPYAYVIINNSIRPNRNSLSYNSFFADNGRGVDACRTFISFFSYNLSKPDKCQKWVFDNDLWLFKCLNLAMHDNCGGH